MCGIALIVSVMGGGTAPPPAQPDKVTVSVHDIESALRRRGPDSLGRKTLTIPLQHDESCLQVSSEETSVELQFIGATLQLRGLHPVLQPFVDSYGNILVYNGEIFGGIEVGSDGNDGEVLMETLGNCGEGNGSIPDVLSKIKGPWAVIYWQNSSRTLWFGRDAFGRRSLLVRWPTMKDSQFLLSSVSPFSSVDQSSGILYSVETENGNRLNFLEELSCGIYSLSMDAPKLDERLFGEVRKHEWANKMLVELIEWERVSVKPDPEELRVSHCRALMEKSETQFFFWPDQGTPSLQAQNVLTALRKSMVLRSSLQIVRCNSRDEELAPVAVLFSGGLDSMILAALLDECLDPSYGIDLLNVSFDGLSAPDRISARAGVKELMKIAASRRWKLVEIDAEMSNLTSEIKHVRSLISPANTYMDLNIGCALWLAACGDGVVYKGTSHNNEENPQPSRYRSKARIVLVGSGADEQCAGYGRHRTKYRSGSWLGLHEEMKLDMQRIWKRNMGRDDRCIADNGKEARFPFLDEDVIRTLLDIPLWKVANLDQPSGKGDKKILREVAQMLGLYEAANLPKRAIQFGSRIARESNRKNFGSNRAANQASAGSAVIDL